MGYEPINIPFIKMARDRGLGMDDVDQIEIVGDVGRKRINEFMGME